MLADKHKNRWIEIIKSTRWTNPTYGLIDVTSPHEDGPNLKMNVPH